MSEFRPLFDGETLNGWYAVPRQPQIVRPESRLYESLTGRMITDKEYFGRLHRHTGKWTVEDGAIVGRQDPPKSGLGGFLVSQEKFRDFELSVEVKPDWPADTGIFIRATPDACAAIQVLLDYRKSGGLAGFYGNGVGNFHAVAFNVDGIFDENGKLIGVKEEDPATTHEPITPDKPKQLTYSIDADTFFKNWKFDDWNEYRIVCKGEIPVVTLYVNGLKAAEMDLNLIEFSNQYRSFKPQDITTVLGTEGHIAFEIHEDFPHVPIDRWGEDTACRWRNIKIREL